MRRLPLLLAAAALCLAQPNPGGEQKDEAQPGLHFRLLRRPSLRYGEHFRIDLRARVQLDFRGFDPVQNPEEADVFELHRGRVGVEGRFLRDFEYEVEYDVGAEERAWRDAFLNYRRFRRFQIQAGRFKIPFGMETLTGAANLDFPLRTRVSRYLTPARDLGVQLHGRFLQRALNYEAGVFVHDGDNALDRFEEPTGQRTFAARLTGTPLRRLPVVRHLEVGGAFTESPMNEGALSVRGRTYAKETFFPHMFVRGRRLRLGAELRWMPGPFGLKGEFIHVREQRREQGLRGNDLPDLISRGWYVSGTWVVTGEKKAEGVEPRRAFGAVELATRWEALRFGSSQHPGNPSRGTRAPNVLPNSDRAWSAGVNWYLNRYVKVQGHAFRERIEDPQRVPVPGDRVYWLRLLRLQFVL